MENIKINKEQAIEFGILKPVADRENEYILNGRPVVIEPEDEFSCEVQITRDNRFREDNEHRD